MQDKNERPLKHSKSGGYYYNDNGDIVPIARLIPNKNRAIGDQWFFRAGGDFPGPDICYHHDLCSGWKEFMGFSVVY